MFIHLKRLARPFVFQLDRSYEIFQCFILYILVGLDAPRTHNKLISNIFIRPTKKCKNQFSENFQI